MPGRPYLRAPDNLNVRGRGLSPGRDSNGESPMSPALSSRASLSDDEEMSQQSEEYTVLDGVREMNQILVRQIETLRLKIKVDEDNHSSSHAKMLDNKNTEIESRDDEIDTLKDNLKHRDDTIHMLTKASEEKDKTIESKVKEIEDMKKVVEQTKKYASRLHKQWSKVKFQKEGLEKDTIYKEQNTEITRLTEELEVLRSRLTMMEEELKRATEVIELQNEKMASMDTERVVAQAKFREELDKASRAMRQEVERMREVMHQNCEEMRTLREQNKEMHNDVRLIKELLRASRDGAMTSRANGDSPNPTMYATQTHGQSTALAPKGPGKMEGRSVANRSAALKRITSSIPSSIPMNRENTQHNSHSMHNSRNGGFRNVRASVPTDLPDDKTASARGSPDQSARTMSPTKTHLAFPGVRLHNQEQVTQYALNTPNNNHNPRSKHSPNLPPVASIREGVIPIVRQSTKVVGSGVRKGSALKK